MARQRGVIPVIRASASVTLMTSECSNRRPRDFLNQSYDTSYLSPKKHCHRSGQNLSYDTLNFQNLKIRMVSAHFGLSTISHWIY